MMIVGFFWIHYILGCNQLPHTTLNFSLSHSLKRTSYQKKELWRYLSAVSTEEGKNRTNWAEKMLKEGQRELALKQIAMAESVLRRSRSTVVLSYYLSVI